MYELHNDLPFLPERIKEKDANFVANLHDKKEYSQKKYKESIKSWINFEKGTYRQSLNSIK